jgi:hypothetical protein
MTGVPNDERTWTTWTTPRERVKAWALTDDAPRSANGIAFETCVRADRTREILSDLVAEGVVMRVERNGVVRYGPDRDHMKHEADQLLADAEDVEDLYNRRDDMVQRLDDVKDPVVERLVAYHLKITDLAIKTVEAGDMS